ncbi:BTB/POZ domain-containing protein kctd14 [Borealophlyctis nickersoniae]|nr:BTB/POZ domain-containing protein kctd14 [Borealophlyctis nickersoniae]
MTDVSSDIVTLNVGGRLFTTTRSTLSRYPDSMLARLAAWPHDEPTETTGSQSSSSSSTPLIDRNPDTFELVLTYLRDDRGERYEQWIKKDTELQRVPISPDVIAHTEKSPKFFEHVSGMNSSSMKEVVDQLEKLKDAELKAGSCYSWSLWKVVHGYSIWSVVVHRHRVAE